MGSGASSHTTPPRSTRGAAPSSGFWCHECQTTFDQLADGGVCPACQGGFVEEAASVAVIAQAARWLAGSGGAANSTEARIARLLDDLHAHLEMVEGLHATMRRAMDATAEDAARPHLDAAPAEVLDAIETILLDSNTLKSMRQTAQCVVCCADFEVGEELSRLPGCGHLFHPDCVRQWLDRAANCPICRRNLVEAVVGPREALSTSTSSSATLPTATPPSFAALDAPQGTVAALPAAAALPTPVAAHTGPTAPSLPFGRRRYSGTVALPAPLVSSATPPPQALPSAPSGGLASVAGTAVGHPGAEARGSGMAMGLAASMMAEPRADAALRPRPTSSVLMGAGSATITLSPGPSAHPPSPAGHGGAGRPRSPGSPAEGAAACGHTGTAVLPHLTAPAAERHAAVSRRFGHRR